MRKTLVSRFIVPAIVVSVALGLIFNEVEAADPAVVSTWKGGIHFLPASATRSGYTEDVSFKGESLEQWAQRLTREVVKPDAKIPAVIYAHGCKGPVAASNWGAFFTEIGFAFFAPDSFRRPDRFAGCYDGGSYAWRMRMRNEEILYALDQVRSLQWVDQKRLVLMGKSEGGAAVARFGGDEFKAHIILAYDCRATGGSPAAPSDVAVLNVVGADDPREGLCANRRNFGGSKSVALQGQGHTMVPVVAGATVTDFLKACCGYKPVNTTAGMDVEEIAKKLVEEFGGLATMDAMLKAEEAAGKGDEEGHKFWMRVHEIAIKIAGG